MTINEYAQEKTKLEQLRAIDLADLERSRNTPPKPSFHAQDKRQITMADVIAVFVAVAFLAVAALTVYVNWPAIVAFVHTLGL